MADARQVERGGDLYERLLQRLALALEEADTASRLHAEPLRELELDGLSPAELELIRAYLNRDLAARLARGGRRVGADTASATAQCQDR